MFDTLPHDIVRRVVEFVSFEVSIYLFPNQTIKESKYDYLWALCFKNIHLRIRLLMWLIRNNCLPANSLTLDRIGNTGNLFIFKRVISLITSKGMLIDSYYSTHLVDWVSGRGKTHLLDWWYNFCLNCNCRFKYSVQAIDSASINGEIEILNWWKTRYLNGTTLIYSRDAIDKTSSIGALDWWFDMYQQYGIQLKYSTRSIDYTSNPEVLSWWLDKHLKFGIRLRYKKASINHASSKGDLNILNWWMRCSARHYFITLKYDESAIDLASANGHLHVLDWWMTQHLRQTGFLFMFSNSAIDQASANGHLHILEWWFDQYKLGRCNLKRSVYAVNYASRNGHIEILDWWMNLHIRHHISLLYDLHALEWALENSSSMHWWIDTCSRHKFIFQHINWNQYYFCIE